MRTDTHFSQPAGFTLVELVMTLVIIGILAAVALPRMNVIGSFDETGYRDQVIAALEFARKSAVAQRRNVQVTRAGNVLTFSIDNCHPEGSAASVPPCVNAVNTFPRALNLPGTNANWIAPRGQTTLEGPLTLVFNPRGQASLAATYTTTIDGVARNLTVDADTGYVR
jgi:MSHA pilin protein MshC